MLRSQAQKRLGARLCGADTSRVRLHNVLVKSLRLVVRHLLLLSLCVGGLVSGLAGSSPVRDGTPAQQAQTVVVSTALSAVGDTSQFPVDVPARSVRLPDEWALSRPGEKGPVWYRIAFAAQSVRERGDLLSLYIERACTNLEVYLNGQLVHSGGRMQQPITRNCNHPQLIAMPAAVIAPGVNTLDIKVVGYPLQELASRHRAGGLSAIEVGPQSLLARKYALHLSLHVEVAQSLSATLTLMGGFMFVMGWMNRRESHLAYFGALSVGWALADTRLWWRELPVSGPVAEFLLCCLLPFITLAAVQFLLRYSKRRFDWVDRGLAAQCAVLPVTLLLAGSEGMYGLMALWYLVLVAQIGAAGVFVLRWLRAGGGSQRAFWAAALLLCAVAAAVLLDTLSQVLALPELLLLLPQVLMPVTFVLVGLRLVQQHGRALQSAEQSREVLETRVREATAEIERNFRQLSELRVEQVTERERKRIAGDLHDDLGAKLLTIVHTSESERISTLAREALEEMRLSVRGLTGKAVNLGDALGDWRAEVVSRLMQAGIEGEWQAPAEDLPQTLSARAFVQTTRILREAVSNIIKHAGASRCSVTVTLHDGDFMLTIQDNGKGIPMELDGRLDRGHGMASMKHRAKQLAGQCLVESGPGYGTVIRLTIPLDRAIEAG
jgi:two-component system, NarL family, sensor histidine kinase UhpB